MAEDPEIHDEEFEEAELWQGPKDASNPWEESPEALKARRQRSVFLALGLVAFVIIVFIVTIVKLKGNVVAGSHL